MVPKETWQIYPKMYLEIHSGRMINVFFVFSSETFILYLWLFLSDTYYLFLMTVSDGNIFPLYDRNMIWLHTMCFGKKCVLHKHVTCFFWKQDKKQESPCSLGEWANSEGCFQPPTQWFSRCQRSCLRESLSSIQLPIVPWYCISTSFNTITQASSFRSQRSILSLPSHSTSSCRGNRQAISAMQALFPTPQCHTCLPCCCWWPWTRKPTTIDHSSASNCSMWALYSPVMEISSRSWFDEPFPFFPFGPGPPAYNASPSPQNYVACHSVSQL